MRYEDLTVAVEPKPGGGYQVRALASPCGPGTAPFDIPLRRDEIEELIREVGACVSAPHGAGSPASVRDLIARVSAQHPANALERIGARLFLLLLGGAERAGQKVT